MTRLTRRACFVALAISASVVWAHDSPLSYPTPPNPFGDSSAPPPSGGGDGDGDAGLEKLHLPPRAVASARVRRPPVLRRLVCLGALSAVCFASRPHEPSLLAAIEAHHTASGDLVSDFLRSEPVAFRNVGLASVGLHSDLVWLGLLGQWLPLLPTTIEAFRHCRRMRVPTSMARRVLDAVARHCRKRRARTCATSGPRPEIQNAHRGSPPIPPRKGDHTSRVG